MLLTTIKKGRNKLIKITPFYVFHNSFNILFLYLTLKEIRLIPNTFGHQMLYLFRLCIIEQGAILGNIKILHNYVKGGESHQKITWWGGEGNQQIMNCCLL